MTKQTSIFLAVSILWIALGGVGVAVAESKPVTALAAIVGVHMVDQPLHALASNWSEKMPILKAVGESMEIATGPYGIALGAAAIWLADSEAGWRAARALAVTGAITLILKTATQRERPPGAEGRYQLGQGRDSFPSGHAAMAFALATVAAEAFPRWREEALMGAALVGLSRIVAGHHWASDVVAGAWIGHFAASTLVAPAPVWSWEWSF